MTAAQDYLPLCSNTAVARRRELVRSTTGIFMWPVHDDGRVVFHSREIQSGKLVAERYSDQYPSAAGRGATMMDRPEWIDTFPEVSRSARY
jgi:hypothetical protein